MKTMMSHTKKTDKTDTTSETTMDCNSCTTALPDLLLDAEYAASHRADALEHLKGCAACRSEFEGLRATFALMDEWTAPEPTPYFDTRLQARLREEMRAQPEGVWERMRAFLLYSTGRQFRSLAAGALGCALILGGGGTVAGLYNWQQATVKTPVASATVNDLKILDNNAQVEQQLNQLLDDSGSASDPGSGSPTT